MALRWIFSADTSPFRRGLAEMRNETKAWSGTITRMVGGIFTAGAIIAGFRNWLRQIDDLDKASKKLGGSVEDLQRASLIAEKNNLSLQQLTALLVRLQRRFGEAASGSEGYRKRLESLGLTQEALIGADPTAVLIALSTAWGRASQGVTAYSDFLGVLDTEARELIPLLREGPEALAESFAKANITGGKTVAKVAALNDRLTDLKRNVSVGFGLVFDAIGKIGETTGAIIGGIIVWWKRFFEFLGAGFSAVGRSLEGVRTKSLSEIAGGIQDLKTAYDRTYADMIDAAGHAADEITSIWARTAGEVATSASGIAIPTNGTHRGNTFEDYLREQAGPASGAAADPDNPFSAELAQYLDRAQRPARDSQQGFFPTAQDLDRDGPTVTSLRAIGGGTTLGAGAFTQEPLIHLGTQQLEELRAINAKLTTTAGPTPNYEPPRG